MRILYFDCFAGISGDMTIGALLDLGIDRNTFLEELARLNIGGFKIEINKKKKNGISGTDFCVIIDHEHSARNHHHSHRKLGDIEEIIDESGLEERVKILSKEIFSKLAQAESKVHGKPIDEIHFHEIGAVDSIVDIIGTAICIQMLDVERIYSSPLHLGTGFTECAHGLLPVPVPATVELVKRVPVYSTGVRGELVTPTGAAIITTLADDFLPLTNMNIEKIGYGTGKKDYKITNVLRVFLGKAEKPSETIMLETNIDDMNPETYSYIVPLLFDKGALDVYLTNIIMKKGRPAVKLSVLCRRDDSARLEEIIFNETTTIGIRKYSVDRECLDRRKVEIDTKFGRINFKAAYRNGNMLKILPEYEECRRIAEKEKIPLQEVYSTLIQCQKN